MKKNVITSKIRYVYSKEPPKYSSKRTTIKSTID